MKFCDDRAIIPKGSLCCGLLGSQEIANVHVPAVAETRVLQGKVTRLYRWSTGPVFDVFVCTL